MCDFIRFNVTLAINPVSCSTWLCTFVAAICCCILPANAQAPLDKVKKQVPTEQDAIKEQAEFLLKNVPAAPLPAGSTELDAMRKRAKSLQEKHTAYAKAVASGKVDPFSHLRKARPQHERDVASLKNHITQLNNEENPSKKIEISKLLFIALQPVGHLLEFADVGKGYANLLSKDQQKELTRLEKDWDLAGKDYSTDASPLVVLGPGQLYTLTSLSVPIIVKVPPSSTVLFHTHGGGFFSNKLAIIAVQANKEGIATANWVTYGDSIGDTQIGVRSLSAPLAHNLIITTVQPKLRGLPAIPAIPKQVPAVPEVKVDKPTRTDK